MIEALTIAVWFVVIWGLTELVTRLPPRVSLGVFPLVAVVIGSLWVANGVGSPFMFGKLASVAFGAMLGVWMTQEDWAGSSSTALRWVIVVSLVVNILEAVAAESLTAVSANFFAGLLLVPSIPGPSALSVGKETRTDLRFDLTWLWIAAYTLWNFTFVYGTAAPGDPRGQGAGMTALHLGVPLLIARGRADRWLLARCFALCLTFISFPFAVPPVDTSGLYTPAVASALGVLALLLAGAALLQRTLRLRALD